MARRGALVRWALVFVVLVLAGCADGTVKSPEHPGSEVDVCETASAAGAPPGDAAPVALPFAEGFEGPQPLADAGPFPPLATDGSWSVRADPDAPEGSNVAFGHGDADPGFSMLLFPRAGDLEDLEMTVSFNVGCVQHPHGVGVVLHVQDADDYQIIRYSASESAWDFFTVRGGERVRHETAQVTSSTDPAPGHWTNLRVTSVDGRVRAYDGLVQVLDFTLEAADAKMGQVGLFLRGNSDARFDDVAVGPPGLPA